MPSNSLQMPAVELAALCQESRGSAPLVLAWSLGSTASIVVALRLYVKAHLRHSLGWDDYTLTIALITSIIDSSMFTEMSKAGVGRHIECLMPENISDVLKWSAYAQIFQLIALAFVKVSVCLFILRVIDKTSRRINQFLKALIVFIVICHVGALLLQVLQCRPLRAIWDPQIQGQCFSQSTTYTAAYIVIALDALTDLVCAAIPTVVIWGVQMKLRLKVAICILMGLGVLTAGCAIAKEITLGEIVNAVSLGGYTDADYTWRIYEPSIWSILEVHLGLNLTAIPTLKPVFDKVRDRVFKRRSGSGSTLVTDHGPRSAFGPQKTSGESQMRPLQGVVTRMTSVHGDLELDLENGYVGSFGPRSHFST